MLGYKLGIIEQSSPFGYYFTWDGVHMTDISIAKLLHINIDTFNNLCHECKGKMFIHWFWFERKEHIEAAIVALRLMK
jgi:hypothetical protein